MIVGMMTVISPALAVHSQMPLTWRGNTAINLEVLAVFYYFCTYSIYLFMCILIICLFLFVYFKLIYYFSVHIIYLLFYFIYYFSASFIYVYFNYLFIYFYLLCIFY